MIRQARVRWRWQTNMFNRNFFFGAAFSAAVLVSTASSLFAETVWLSSLDLKQMTTVWSTPKANLGITGTPITINGKQFARGVGTHAASTMRLELGGKA